MQKKRFSIPIVILLFILIIVLFIRVRKPRQFFKPSATWVEEDYFTQQEKYCEVDSNYAKKMEKSLKNKNN